MFAERAAPILRALESIRDRRVGPDMDPEQIRTALTEKQAAAEDVPAFRDLLYPEGD